MGRERAPVKMDEKKGHRHDHRKCEDERRKKKRSRQQQESEGESSSSTAASSSSGEETKNRHKHGRGRKHRKQNTEHQQKKKKKQKHEKEKEKGRKRRKEKNKGAVTQSWGKFGIIREIDMWYLLHSYFSAFQKNRVGEEFEVNLETLPAWEEKQLFKEYMEDYNTATFPSKKYYDLDLYHRRKMIKEMEKGALKAIKTERTVFNDEEQRRQELRKEREQQKEAEVEALKRSMQSGMAKAMKEQAQLREEMNYQFRLGNYEAAAAIQRRLDPDVQM